MKQEGYYICMCMRERADLRKLISGAHPLRPETQQERKSDLICAPAAEPLHLYLAV